jgi:7-keto-8-aminopelargonate synthetase-like enzyme
MPIAPPLQQVDRTFVRHEGRRLIYFGGCDYFRLASHRGVLRALNRGAAALGLNVSASRGTTGNHEIYGALEDDLARFFGSEAALLVASGYVTNLVVAQALAGRFTHALIDERAHGSLLDAAQLLGVRFTPFRHRDADAAGAAARRLRPGSKIILLTDGMFSHDGSAAPLADYLRALPRTAMLLVDDAHGAGVLGATGRGTVEHAGIARARVIQTVSLSKAFGAYGGAVLGARKVREAIISRSRLFMGNTPLPLPLAAAARKAVELLGGHPAWRKRMNAGARFVKDALRTGGVAVPETPGPIVAFVPRDTVYAARVERSLLAHGVFPSLIRYHGGPPGGYFRFAISSEHKAAQLQALVNALIKGA